MHNISHLKSLIGTELEALLIEINNLKTRVTVLEQDSAIQYYYKKEYIGKWINNKPVQSSMITCNTSELI
jgi:hypothetical protein